MKIVFGFAVLLISSFSYASDCGGPPTEPVLLNVKQVDSEKMQSLSDEMDVFFNKIDVYQQCLGEMLTSMDPESSDYQEIMANTSNQIMGADQMREMAINKYNRHIELINSISSEQNSMQSDDEVSANNDIQE